MIIAPQNYLMGLDGNYGLQFFVKFVEIFFAIWNFSPEDYIIVVQHCITDCVFCLVRARLVVFG